MQAFANLTVRRGLGRSSSWIAIVSRAVGLRFSGRVLAGALVCVVVLGVFGRNLEADLSPSSPSMPGSQSARADAQLRRYFGDATPFAILLRGPAAQLERQGPALVRALKREPGATTLSPWDKGPVGVLRPKAGQALILVDLHDDLKDAVEHDVDRIEQVLERSISPPVVATQSSYPSYLKGLRDASNSAAERGELIAFPVLALILLLVFRSPIAAGVPILLGVGTVASARGLLTLLSHWLNIDAFALPVSAMIGLALGVDYALLMVSRFREELSTGSSPTEAAVVTRQTAGRTVLAAGGTLFVSLLLVLFLVPGQLFRSVIGAMLLVTGLSVLFAVLVAPPLLAVLGPNVNRWQVSFRSSRRPRWLEWVAAALRRPGLTAAVIGVLMVLLALPALGLNIGSSGPEQLPSDSPVRRNMSLIDHFAGPGWSAPFTVVASTEKGSITDPRRMAEISLWQQEVADIPAVQTVIGPRRILERVTPLRRSGNELLGEVGEDRLDRVGRLGAKLERAATGVLRLQGGMAEAAQGAGLLGEGSQRARSGALTVAGGLRRAGEAGQRGSEATERLARGSGKLVKGQQATRFGALEIELGLEGLIPILGREGLGVARPLHRDLERRASSQPELKEDADRADQVVIQLAKAKAEVRRLHRLSSRLHAVLGSLAKGSTRLLHGAKLLSRYSRRLNAGLEKLADGSEQLAAGLGRLRGGSEALQGNLGRGADRVHGLQVGLKHAGTTVSAEAQTLGHGIGRLRRNSPGIFNSGGFVLAALSGTAPERRKEIAQTVDLDTGEALRIVVVANHALNSPGSEGLYDELQQKATELEGKAKGFSVGVAGGEPQVADFAAIAANRFPLSALAITVVTFLMLVVMLRAVLLPAIAVLLNLASVAVAFGVVALVDQLPAGVPLGGHRILDVTGATAIFTVAFALSIDYAVFLMMRMRESYDRDGDHDRAITFGIERTGRVITGAAAVMGAVFLAFGSVPLALLSQMGIGLAVAVLVDATVVRLVLLPSLMKFLGEGVWKLPRSLERLIPRGFGH